MRFGIAKRVEKVRGSPIFIVDEGREFVSNAQVDLKVGRHRIAILNIDAHQSLAVMFAVGTGKILYLLLTAVPD